jgi:hypothetical protein
MAGFQHHEIAAEEHNVRLGTIQGIACRCPQIRVCGGAGVEVGSEGDPERRCILRPIREPDVVLRSRDIARSAEQPTWPPVASDDRLDPFGSSFPRCDSESAHAIASCLKHTLMPGRTC